MGNHYSPRLRKIVTYGVVALWATSVGIQMAASVFGFTWTAPTGLNELGTGVVMAILAKNKQSSKEEKAAEKDGPNGGASAGPDAPEIEGDD